MFSKKIIKKITMVSFLALSVLASNVSTAYAKEMRASQDIVNEMGIGWNLGNTLDASYDGISENANSSEYETSWGNPVTTKAMIDEIKKAGFKTVRIPTTWGPHVGAAPDYKISEDWLNRVQEVVDYCIDNGLYAILNVHHDSEWCTPTYNAEKGATEKLEKIWTQVATRFKDYDDHLIFEGLNEPRVINSAEEWTGGTSEGRDVVNRYNAAALKAIRATGGNNKNRSVMLPTYAASGSKTTIEDFKLPQDDNIIVSLHCYLPYEFAMNPSGTDKWGSDEDKKSLDTEFDYFYDTFVSKGIPVVIGEFGSVNKNNLSSRVTHARYFVSTVLKRNMACIWWDNNLLTGSDGTSAETFGLFNRQNLSWHFPEVKDALIAGYKDIKGEDNNNNSSDKDDSNNSNDNNNSEDKNESNDSNSDNSNNENDATTGNDSDLSVSAKLNSWFFAYQVDMTITNNTDKDIEDWCLKIKKSDINILVSWDADLSKDEEYTIFTPKHWKTTIPAGQSITVSFQGVGAGCDDFGYVINK